jgi:hypothetical protein
VLCAQLLNLSIIILLSTAAVFLSNMNSTSAPKSSHFSVMKRVIFAAASRASSRSMGGRASLSSPSCTSGPLSFPDFLASELAGSGTLPLISPYPDSAERAVAGADTKLVLAVFQLAVFQGRTEWELVPLLLDCLFMLALLVLLVDGQGICHGRP